MTTTSNPKEYFDLHTTGLGYLNRIREVKPKQGKRGDSFLACTIAALNGPSDTPDYRYFDVRVSGTDAQHLIRRCVSPVEARKKVLLGFRIGDGYPDAFTFQGGPRKGEQGLSIKGRLLFVNWIKVDGELVYKAAPKDSQDAAVNPSADADVSAAPKTAPPSPAEVQAPDVSADAPLVDPAQTYTSNGNPAAAVGASF